MRREFLRFKLHRATVSATDKDYVGSVTIPAGVCRRLDVGQGEKCDVVNIDTGARVTTYVIHGDKPGYICLNGAAARLFMRGDRIIVIGYCELEPDEIQIGRAHD